jgi:hypothetical protein
MTSFPALTSRLTANPASEGTEVSITLNASRGRRADTSRAARGRSRYTAAKLAAPSSAISGNGAIQPPRAIRNPMSGMPRMNASDQLNSVIAIVRPRRA